ncbi:unnamed protein product [Notodromas monacha]|uniref:Uncharacterized protein n=1 Tax=Notodromas monacha TaxID=399045 RepID=A0A7R9BXP2_9CRUS|nr:unnamed protein product [Notodromas monacha]CAG0923283.1 unnamed protein product [Notodromas monacha]
MRLGAVLVVRTVDVKAAVVQQESAIQLGAVHVARTVDVKAARIQLLLLVRSVVQDLVQAPVAAIQNQAASVLQRTAVIELAINNRIPDTSYNTWHMFD